MKILRTKNIIVLMKRFKFKYSFEDQKCQKNEICGSGLYKRHENDKPRQGPLHETKNFDDCRMWNGAIELIYVNLEELKLKLKGQLQSTSKFEGTIFVCDGC